MITGKPERDDSGDYANDGSLSERKRRLADAESNASMTRARTIQADNPMDLSFGANAKRAERVVADEAVSRAKRSVDVRQKQEQSGRRQAFGARQKARDAIDD